MHQSDHKKPVIGITCGEVFNKDEPWSPVMFGQSRTYTDCIIAAGGTPLLLPLADDEDLLHTLGNLLDGLCLSGGNGLHPALYGHQIETATNDSSELRDTTELTLLRQALAGKKPVLGICRGMQLLNVHCGGTLYQEIEKDVPGALDHDISSKRKTLVDLAHTLTIKPGSRLAHILGSDNIGTNAHHHQAINKLGDSVEAQGWAEDGVIEAIELTNYPYVIGVQSHPESLTHVEPRWKRLFESFVAAAT